MKNIEYHQTDPLIFPPFVRTQYLSISIVLSYCFPFHTVITTQSSAQSSYDLKKNTTSSHLYPNITQSLLLQFKYMQITPLVALFSDDLSTLSFCMFIFLKRHIKTGQTIKTKH